MKKVLIVVDVQNDFVTGSLGTKEAQYALENIIKKVKEFEGEIIFTKDTHHENYLQTREGKYLPIKHCIEGEEGYELVSELERIRSLYNYKVFKKPTFASVNLAIYLLDLYNKNELESVELIGLCTDICVISNALMIKGYMPELDISVDASCCAGVSKEKHLAALEVLKSNQIIVEGE